MNMRLYGEKRDRDIKNPVFLAKMSQNSPPKVQSKSTKELTEKQKQQDEHKSNGSLGDTGQKLSIHQNRVQRQNITKEVQVLQHRMSLLQQEEQKIQKQTQKIQSRTNKVHHHKIQNAIRQQDKNKGNHEEEEALKEQTERQRAERMKQKERMQLIKDEIQRKKEEQRNLIRQQREENKKQIEEEKMKEQLQKQDRRKIIQENLLTSQEIIDKYWVNKLAKCQEIKQEIYNNDQQEYQRHQQVMQQLESQELEMIQKLEQKQNKQINESIKLESIYQQPLNTFIQELEQTK